MNQLTPITEADSRILKIAVLAVGGQGGGVLSGWITTLAEQNGYHAQSTSVPGVAQRTGATIYYIEMKRIDPSRGDKRPVFALMPANDDVDIVIASELVEAGRAMLRRLVSPERTLLIGSAHRNLTIFEKQVPGDGRTEAEKVAEVAKTRAKDFIFHDFERIAKNHGSVISSSLFGALAGSGALPFDDDAFRAVIRASGRGVDRSLAAFDAAMAHVQSPPQPKAAKPEDPAEKPPADLVGPPGLLRDFAALSARVDALPDTVAKMARHGLHTCVDYQDIAYGKEYLDRVDQALSGDAAPYTFSVAAAKYLSRAMCYDDILRVADIKTRASREDRVRREIGATPEAIVAVTEYFHPRAEEVSSLMPTFLAQRLRGSDRAMKLLDRLVNRGRRYRTDGISGFVLLWLTSGLRPFRRRLYRHTEEMAHMQRWFDLALDKRAINYELGVEVLRCRRLIKGYSDTHARGLSKFDRVIGGLDMLGGRADAADWLRRLKDAALMDEDGKNLDGALETIRQM